MSQTRIYLPLSAEQGRALDRRRCLEDAARTAHAVTRALEVASPGAGTEVHEHQALQAAARAALEQAGRNGARVVVAAVDVDPDLVEDGAGQKDEPSTVRVTGTLPLRRFASFHVSDPDVAPSASVKDEDLELSWYDATELEVLLDLW